jgi:RNA polymerase sigma-70 factor (ECF subfamily)
VNGPSDEALLLRYQKGDAAAFRDLYLRYRVPTFNFVLHLVRDKAVAEDLHQEIWIGITRSALQWKPTGTVRGWLYQIARNRCYDHFRSRGRAVSEEDDDQALIETAAPIVPQASDGKLRDAIVDCIGTLNDSQRQVFVLRAVQDMTFAEITELMTSPPGLSNRRMQLAVEHLKRCLERKGIRDEP